MGELQNHAGENYIGNCLTPRLDNDTLEIVKAKLLESIAQVGTIAPEDLEAMADELTPHLSLAETNYDDYQNGGWRLLAIYNNSGDPTDTTVRENEAVQATPLLNSMPTIQKVIEGFFPRQNIVLARIARFSPGGRLWEHVDYTELTEETPRLRFHIPIATEPEAVFVTGGHRIHMGAGHLWVINPRGAHGIAHEGKQDRIHLIIDATIDEKIALEPGRLDNHFIEKLELLDASAVKRQIMTLARFILSGQAEEAEQRGLNMFYKYTLPSSHTSHQVIAAAYAEAQHPEGESQWLQKNELYMKGGYRHD